jgi:uncharacterized protein YjbI with pentapeptide repeats
MADQEHLDILKQGAEVWNEWREEEFYTRPQLRDADLREIDLTNMSLWEADLSGANLEGKNLSGLDLTDVTLTGANLESADLSGARLMGANCYTAELEAVNLTGAYLAAADFRGAGLERADLRDSELGGANLSGAELYQARFDRSTFNATVLGYNNLSVVTGLESIIHKGPSVIGIDTLYQSGGNIDKTFLRGCGVPDEFITFLPSLIGAQQAIDFYSCFISHSHKDNDFANRLHSRMQQEHLRVWFAPEDVKGGRHLIDQIDRAIRVYDKLLLVLSHDSLESEWVITEIRKALRIEKAAGSRKLFPIRLVDMRTIQAWECFDSDSGTDLAVEVRKYYIPDFSQWKDNDMFETVFDRLLRDLKPEKL